MKAQVHGSDLTHNDWRIALTPLSGGVSFDEHLANYNWDVRPATLWGGQVSVRKGRYELGARMWRTGTTQATGFPGDTDALQVNLTSAEMLGAFRLVEYFGFQLWSTTHAGRMHMGYSPDALTVDIGGALGPVTVQFDEISEWQVGAGVKIEREFAQRIGIGVHGERSSFAMDTAHRSGSEIVETRERFYSWTLRAQVSWLISIN